MVKNKKGGRNNRKMASKHAQPSNTSRIRFAKDDDEMYAKVVKMLGGRRAEIICNDKNSPSNFVCVLLIFLFKEPGCRSGYYQ